VQRFRARLSEALERGLRDALDPRLYGTE